MPQSNVIVVAGGLSHERDVSLRSGRRVAKALRGAGHRVQETDLNTELLGLIEATDNAVVVPMLHGGLGEDGALREVLETVGVPFVGSTGAASRLTFVKSIATPVARANGIRTPGQVALPHEMFQELGAGAVMDALGTRLGFPLMVKPARSGSALGASRVQDADDLAGALMGAFAYSQVAVIEEFIEGTEVAVTVIDTGDVPQALPPVEVRAAGGVYDYEARYNAGSTRFVTPAELDDDVLTAAQEMAVTVHRVFGLRDLSRTDIIVTDDGPVFIEGNVAPGMTETSLAPLAFEAAGLGLGEVFSDLIEVAASR